MIPRHLPTSEVQLSDFCQRWHIQRLSFFGSVTRDDFRPDSDVDVLIEFQSGHTPGFDIYDVEQELSELCGGRLIDIVNPKYLHRWLKDDVLATAEPAFDE